MEEQQNIPKLYVSRVRFSVYVLARNSRLFLDTVWSFIIHKYIYFLITLYNSISE